MAIHRIGMPGGAHADTPTSHRAASVAELNERAREVQPGEEHDDDAGDEAYDDHAARADGQGGVAAEGLGAGGVVATEVDRF